MDEKEILDLAYPSNYPWCENCGHCTHCTPHIIQPATESSFWYREYNPFKRGRCKGCEWCFH